MLPRARQSAISISIRVPPAPVFTSKERASFLTPISPRPRPVRLRYFPDRMWSRLLIPGPVSREVIQTPRSGGRLGASSMLPPPRVEDRVAGELAGDGGDALHGEGVAAEALGEPPGLGAGLHDVRLRRQLHADPLREPRPPGLTGGAGQRPHRVERRALGAGLGEEAEPRGQLLLEPGEIRRPQGPLRHQDRPLRAAPDRLGQDRRHAPPQDLLHGALDDGHEPCSAPWRRCCVFSASELAVSRASRTTPAR